MAEVLFRARLQRDDVKSPWGFRLQGGAEYKTPLKLLKVKEDSVASRGGLQAGDIVVKLSGLRAGDTMTHTTAQDVIQQSGNVLEIIVERSDVSQPSESSDDDEDDEADKASTSGSEDDVGDVQCESAEQRGSSRHTEDISPEEALILAEACQPHDVSHGVPPHAKPPRGSAPWRRRNRNGSESESSGDNSDSSITSNDSSDEWGPAPPSSSASAISTALETASLPSSSSSTLSSPSSSSSSSTSSTPSVVVDSRSSDVIPHVTVNTTPVSVPCVIMSEAEGDTRMATTAVHHPQDHQSDVNSRKYPWRNSHKNATEHDEHQYSGFSVLQDDSLTSSSSDEMLSTSHERTVYPWRTHDHHRVRRRSISPGSLTDSEIVSIMSPSNRTRYSAQEESRKTITVAKTLPLHESLVSALNLEASAPMVVASHSEPPATEPLQMPYVGYSPEELAESLQNSAKKSGLAHFNTSDPNFSEIDLSNVPMHNVKQMVQDLDRRLDIVAAKEPTLSNAQNVNTRGFPVARSRIPDNMHYTNVEPGQHELFVDSPMVAGDTVYIDTSQPISAETLESIKQTLFGHKPVEENTYERLYSLTSPITSPPPMLIQQQESDRVSPRSQGRKVHFADPVEHSVIEIPPNWSRRRIRRQEQRDIAAAAAAMTSMIDTPQQPTTITTLSAELSNMRPSIVISPTGAYEGPAVKHVMSHTKAQPASSKITLVPTVPPVRLPVQKTVVRTLSPTYSNAPSLQSSNRQSLPQTFTNPILQNHEQIQKGLLLTGDMLPYSPDDKSPQQAASVRVLPGEQGVQAPAQRLSGIISPPPQPYAHIPRPRGINVSIRHKRADQIIPTRFAFAPRQSVSTGSHHPTPPQQTSQHPKSSEPVGITYSSPPSYEESMRNKSRLLHKNPTDNLMLDVTPSSLQAQSTTQSSLELQHMVPNISSGGPVSPVYLTSSPNHRNVPSPVHINASSAIGTASPSPSPQAVFAAPTPVRNVASPSPALLLQEQHRHINNPGSPLTVASYAPFHHQQHQHQQQPTQQQQQQHQHPTGWIRQISKPAMTSNSNKTPLVIRQTPNPMIPSIASIAQQSAMKGYRPTGASGSRPHTAARASPLPTLPSFYGSIPRPPLGGIMAFVDKSMADKFMQSEAASGEPAFESATQRLVRELDSKERQQDKH